jgi:hypothetical protein
MTMDANTQWFLSIVDCAPEDVRDIPSDRIGVDPLFIPAGASQSALATTEIHFGKYKGKRFSEVPRSYLEWLVAAPKLRGHKKIEKTKQLARKFLRQRS